MEKKIDEVLGLIEQRKNVRQYTKEWYESRRLLCMELLLFQYTNPDNSTGVKVRKRLSLAGRRDSMTHWLEEVFAKKILNKDGTEFSDGMYVYKLIEIIRNNIHTVL